MHIFVGKKFKKIEASLLLYLVRKLQDRFSGSQLKVNIVSENIHKDFIGENTSCGRCDFIQFDNKRICDFLSDRHTLIVGIQL